MKKITLALITVLLLGLETIKAQEQELSASEPISSGCVSRSYEGQESSLPTIKLTKNGSTLSVDLYNYSSNCGTTSFEVENRICDGNGDMPSIIITIAPVVPGGGKDCNCPFNISYTVRNMEKSKFYLTCWWYEGLVELKEGEQLVFEYKAENVVIDGLKYSLLKTTHQALLAYQGSWDGDSQILNIPSEVEYEGEKYTVTSINESVFKTNNTITKIIIPKTIKNTGFGSLEGIVKNPFSSCLSLETIEVEDGNPAMCSIDGVLFNKDKTTLISYPAALPGKSYTVPDNVETVASGAFYSNQHLKNIVLPDKMETMGYSVFAICNSLEEVILPSNIKELPAYLFKDCKNLKSVAIPDGVTSIGSSAFEGCISLETISLPESVVTVEMTAFKGCTSLWSATLSPNLKEIPLAAFSNCSRLTEVIIPSGITTIGNGAFSDCKAMQAFDLPESIIYIDNFAFRNISNLKDIYCRATTVPKTNDFAFNDVDISRVTLHVPTTSISDYKAAFPWNQFGAIVSLETLNDYIPFVKNGKQWHVVRSESNSGCHIEQYMLLNDEVVKDGKTYIKMYRSEDDLTIVDDAGLLREENCKVYFFDSDKQKEFLMFDYSLKEGDTYETYSWDEQETVTYKVLSVDYYKEGPEASFNYYDEKSDRILTYRRYLQKWTVCRADDYSRQKTWIEGVGSIEGPLANLNDIVPPGSSKDYLACVNSNDDSLYLPFSFHDVNGLIHGCDLPTDAEAKLANKRHQLTYIQEENRLHIFGEVLTKGNSKNYAYFIEEPTDNPSVRKLRFEIQAIGPLPDPLPGSDGMTLHSTNFYVDEISPSFDYIIVDNQGEEHPVINAKRMAYRPFVEDGKVWKVGYANSGKPVQVVDYYYFDGDTIVAERTCKQMMCLRYVNPDYSDYDHISQSPILSYVGAWLEVDKQVYIYDETTKWFARWYDFSHDGNLTQSIDYHSYVIGPRQAGELKGFKGVYRDITIIDRKQTYNTIWMEGVGGIDGPLVNDFDKENHTQFLMSCTVGDEVIYFNDEYEDGATPDGARKNRIDFTHTIKIRPKAPKAEAQMMREAEAKSLYGEYNDQQLGINLNALDDAYQVRITDEAGKAVYEKTVNAGNIVGLNINISDYAEGRYTVTVENSNESFTAQFDTQRTGISLTPALIRGEEAIYNLQGQRISSLRKGLNIVDGRKVYVK